MSILIQSCKLLQAAYYPVDILADEALRQAVKAYSDWPTYPQLYVKGELVGGCDIVTEMSVRPLIKAWWAFPSTSSIDVMTHET